jgi:hypothetical protein
MGSPKHLYYANYYNYNRLGLPVREKNGKKGKILPRRKVSR